MWDSKSCALNAHLSMTSFMVPFKNMFPVKKNPASNYSTFLPKHICQKNEKYYINEYNFREIDVIRELLSVRAKDETQLSLLW